VSIGITESVHAGAFLIESFHGERASRYHHGESTTVTGQRLVNIGTLNMCWPSEVGKIQLVIRQITCHIEIGQ